MSTAHKACPVVIREKHRKIEILAFAHPLAGNQIVKGGVEAGESPEIAALRELSEESGIADCTSIELLSKCDNICDRQTWYFVLCKTQKLPDNWTFFTQDDGGHEFQFFWHPLDEQPDANWHPVFVRALTHIRQTLT